MADVPQLVSKLESKRRNALVAKVAVEQLISRSADLETSMMILANEIVQLQSKVPDRDSRTWKGTLNTVHKLLADQRAIGEGVAKWLKEQSTSKK